MSNEQIRSEYAAMYRPLITLTQAAEIAQRPIGTIYDWSARGRFDEFKIRLGREVRLKRDDFVALILEGDEK